MTLYEFRQRCEREYKEREPNKQMITFIGEAIAALCFIIAVILMFIDAEEYSVAMIILMCVSIGILFLFVAPVRWDLSKRIRQYQNDGSYKNYPVDHPYSFLYPGEPYPFPGAASNYVHTAQSAPRQQATSNYTQAPPPNYTQSAPRQQAAPNYTQAPPPNHAQTNNTNAAAKEVVFCIHCKQKLRVPTDKGTITVSCPACKNSFKYTPNK